LPLPHALDRLASRAAGVLVDSPPGQAERVRQEAERAEAAERRQQSDAQKMPPPPPPTARAASKLVKKGSGTMTTVVEAPVVVRRRPKKTMPSVADPTAGSDGGSGSPSSTSAAGGDGSDGGEMTDLQKAFNRRSVRAPSAIFTAGNPYAQKPAAKPTGALDVSGKSASQRASMFEQQFGGDSPPTGQPGDGEMVRSSKSISRAKNGSIKFGSAGKKCKACTKTVYVAEEVSADGVIYHKQCFKCATCTKIVQITMYSAYKGCIYCKPCFMKNFKEKGNYDEGFGLTQHKLKWSGSSGADDGTDA
jgi:hypothetical protein